MVVLPLRVITHGPVPVQAPLHPLNVVPACGAAERVMVVPFGNCDVQVVGQEIPTGEEVIVPCPVPASVTVSEGVATI